MSGQVGEGREKEREGEGERGNREWLNELMIG